MNAVALDALFTYVPPDERTGPLHARLRDAERACAEQVMIALDSPGPQFTAINDACRTFAHVINETCPESADKDAAIRCVRLARMAANESLIAPRTVPIAQLRHQCFDNLRAARWQASAAIALSGA